MGRYEPPKNLRKSGMPTVKKTIISMVAAGAILACGGMARYADRNPELSQASLGELVEYVKHEIAPAPAALPPVQPGDYIFLASVRPENAERQVEKAYSAGIPLLSESTSNGLTRLLVPYEPEILDHMMADIRDTFPSAVPLLFTRDSDGKEHFDDYIPRLANLEAYVQAADGKLDNMPLSYVVIPKAEQMVEKYSLPIPPEEFVRYTYAIIDAESSFRKDARSGKDARGLMQVMPSTAKDINPAIAVSNLYEPRTNVEMGMEVLARNYVELQRTTGHTRVDPVLLVGSFNAGPAGVTRDRAHIRYRETRDYVKKVMYNKRVLRHMR